MDRFTPAEDRTGPQFAAGETGQRNEQAQVVPEDLRAVLGELKSALRSSGSKEKDSWDKLAIVSSFVSSVLIAAVGLFFTHNYDRREREREASAQHAQQRVAELGVITQLVPQLGSGDESIRDLARIAVEAVQQTSEPNTASPTANLLKRFVDVASARDNAPRERTEATRAIATIAGAAATPHDVREQAIQAVTRIAASPSSPAAARDIALDALRELRVVSSDQIEELIKSQPLSRRVDEVMLHHTWRPSAMQYEGTRSIFAMGQFQLQQQGWSHVAFHYAVGPNGDIWTGRPLDTPAINTPGRNDTGVNVTLILDGDTEQPSAEQIRSTAAVLRALFGKLGMTADDNFRAGHGFHSDYTGKACPGRLITKEAVKQWLVAIH